jgi:hypothetical protein
MPPFLYRVFVVLSFVGFMATVYLLLHMLVLRLFRSPDSQVVAFFTVVTSPLTAPVRRLLPRGTPERRVRLATLGLCVLFWLVCRLVTGLVPARVE